MKRFFLFVTMSFLLILQSCKKDEEEPRFLKLSLGKEYHSLNPQQDILGHWESIASGEYEDELRHNNRFNYEFFSDRLTSYSMDYYGTRYEHYSSGTFEICNDSLNMIFDLYKENYYYTFFEDGNILRLAITNPGYNERTVIIDEYGKVYERTTFMLLSNIFYFKRKK